MVDKSGWVNPLRQRRALKWKGNFARGMLPSKETSLFSCNKIIPKEKMHNAQTKLNAPLVCCLCAVLVVILKSNINKSRFAAGNYKLRICFYSQPYVCSREIVLPKKYWILAHPISSVVLAVLDCSGSKCCLLSPPLPRERQVMVPRLHPPAVWVPSNSVAWIDASWSGVLPAGVPSDIIIK